MGIPVIQLLRVGAYILKQKILGRSKYPLVLMVEPLFRCNLACAGCGKIDYPKEFLNQRTDILLLSKIKDIFSESENLKNFIDFIKSQLEINFSLTTTGFENKTIKELIEILSFKIFKNIDNIFTSKPELKSLFLEIDLNSNFGEKIVDEGYQPCYQEIIKSPQLSETKTLRVILLPDQGHYLALIKNESIND